MNPDISLLLAVPFTGAAVSLLLRHRRGVQRAVTVACVAAMLLLALATTATVLASGPVGTQVGGWPAGYAIPLFADAVSAPLVSVMCLLALVCLWFAVTTGEDADGRYLPLVLIVLAGVTGALLTADLFNLFVFFEVMLAGSYVLTLLRPAAGRPGTVYIVTSLVASTLLLAGVGLLYAVAGTTNLGLLRGAAAADATAGLAAVVVLTALAVKSAAVPVHSWLPHAYPHLAPGVAALFSGLLTKVGVYALLRVSVVLFDAEPTFSPVWVAVAIATMVVGVAGALGQKDFGGILSFHMVSQIGYLLAVLALIDSPAALTAGLFFLLQYLLVKGGLFLVAGGVAYHEHTVKLSDLGGLARRYPVGAVAFGLLALSLAGAPPLSGFVGKYLLAIAAFADGLPLLGATVVAVSLFTLLSMLKIWNSAFWGPAPDPDPAPTSPERVAVPAGGSGDARPSGAAAATADGDPGTRSAGREADRGRVFLPAAALAVLTVVAGIAAGPLVDVAATGAEQLLDLDAYVEVTS